jgi:putative transposase
VIDYVRTHADRFGVEPILAVLNEHGCGVAPSTYYAHAAAGFGPTGGQLRQAYLTDALFDLWTANRCLYGRRKLWIAARRAGLDIGRDQVQRLMNLAGIHGVRRGRRRTVTTNADRSRPRHPDHVHRRWRHPSRPDQWWVADFTYVWTTAGFCYVSFVTDVYSRRILGWRVATSKTTPLVSDALQQALFTRRRTNATFTATGLLHHSDAGSQYVSLAFTEALREAGITGSIGSVGDALDNALMESTIGLFKTELIEHERPVWTSWRQVEQATASWVRWYNHDRLHSSIGHLPPAQYEHAHYHSTRNHNRPAAA